MNIVEFLEARIAEDEEENKSLAELEDDDTRGWAIAYAERVLAECAAKRAIIAAHAHHVDMGGKEYGPGFRFVSDGMVQGLMVAIEDLAAVYKDHSDYQQEWGV
jgi:hypothetical protein